MKICIVTTFDEIYEKAGETLFKSIRNHTDCKNIDFKVITSDINVLNRLGKGNCYFIDQDIKNKYLNVSYGVEWPREKYEISWYRYEIFNMSEYDRVICLESDCICIRDISYLFSEDLNEYDIISVEDHIISKCFSKTLDNLEQNGLNLQGLRKRLSNNQIDIQPGLLVVNKSALNERFYRRLLHYANNAPFLYANDQGVLNDFIYMENLNVKLLPLEWNFQDIYELACPEVEVPDNPIIIHCQESKPFKKQKIHLDVKMHKWYDLWWKEYNNEI